LADLQRMVYPNTTVAHQLQVESGTGKVVRPETDILPLFHAANRTTAHISVRFTASVGHAWRAGDADVKREYLTDGNSLIRDLPALTTYQRRGSLQLWQFLIALLENPANTSFIAWTGRGLEFKLVEPEEVSSERT